MIHKSVAVMLAGVALAALLAASAAAQMFPAHDAPASALASMAQPGPVASADVRGLVSA